MEEKIIKLSDGRNLSYGIYGSKKGHPTICLHGTPASFFMFETLEDAANKNDILLICPNRPGIGRSSYKHLKNIKEYTKDIKELSEILGINKFSVIGVSGGGPFAYACLANIPHLLVNANFVSALAPINKSNIKKMGRPQKLILKTFSKNKTLASFLLLIIFKYGKRFKHLSLRIFCLHSKKTDMDVLKEDKIRESLIKSSLSAFESGIKGIQLDIELFLSNWDYSIDSNNNIPINIWHGLDDPTVPHEMANYYETKLPSANKFLMPDSGHHWFYKNMDVVFKKISENL